MVEAVSGKIGTNGRASERAFSTIEERDGWMTKEIAKKTKDGFVERARASTEAPLDVFLARWEAWNLRVCHVSTRAEVWSEEFDDVEPLDLEENLSFAEWIADGPVRSHSEIDASTASTKARERIAQLVAEGWQAVSSAEYPSLTTPKPSSEVLDVIRRAYRPVDPNAASSDDSSFTVCFGGAPSVGQGAASKICPYCNKTNVRFWATAPAIEPPFGQRLFRLYDCYECFKRFARWIDDEPETSHPSEWRNDAVKALRVDRLVSFDDAPDRAFFTDDDGKVGGVVLSLFHRPIDRCQVADLSIKLGGWPTWYQGDRTPTCCGEPTIFLAQLTCGEGDPDTTYGSVFGCPICQQLRVD